MVLVKLLKDVEVSGVLMDAGAVVEFDSVTAAWLFEHKLAVPVTAPVVAEDKE